MVMHEERSIFLKVIEQDSRFAQQATLDQACGDDLQLRERVESLLAAHVRPSNLLDQPIARWDEHILEPPGERREANHQETDHQAPNDSSYSRHMIGRRIGEYRLMEQIGEGGCGLVFVAEQQQPIRRKVALKIVKPGTGSKEVIARFDAERQAIAMMDHPHIAKIFDAGMSTDGQPFFVMELVRGIPITEFAVARNLKIRERLELFQSVCAAVHHAHQKGVIHRDIKPSNVLVTLHDDKSVVKVIDFGVAKAIDHQLTDKTLYTRFFSIVGTPLYMSPEQAELSGWDVDTRSDIYSLGVLLYELLTDMPPYDRARIDSASLDELRRIIREEEPPRPSQRATTVENSEQARSVDCHRPIDHASLSNRGDLDWIVMKAIEKDRNRRYDSASALSDDIARYLLGQPIEARPPSIFYLLTRFGKRNRIAIATMTIVLSSLCVGTVVSLWQARIAMSERDEKVKALQEAHLAKQEIESFASQLTRANALIASGQAHADAGRWREALLDYDAAVEQQPNYFLSWEHRAQLFTRMHQWQKAAADYSQARKLGASIEAAQWWGVPALFAYTQRTDDFQQMCRQLIEHSQQVGRPTLQIIRELSASKDTDAVLAESPWNRTDLMRISFESIGRREESRFPPPGNNRPRHDEFGRLAVKHILPRPVQHYVVAMASLRAADFQGTIDELHHHSVAGGWPSRELRFAPLAMAYHQLGDFDAAQQWIARSNLAVERLIERDEDDGALDVAIPWFDCIELMLINREANQLLSDGDDDSDH